MNRINMINLAIGTGSTYEVTFLLCQWLGLQSAVQSAGEMRQHG